jgi:hypothetical protein
MQTLPPADAVAALRGLLSDPLSAAVTEHALVYMRRLFGRRAGEGVAMAQRALRLAVDEVQVATLCVAFTEQILLARS